MRVYIPLVSKRPALIVWLSNVGTLVCILTFVVVPTSNGEGYSHNKENADLSKGFASPRIPQDFSWRRVHARRQKSEVPPPVSYLKDRVFPQSSKSTLSGFNGNSGGAGRKNPLSGFREKKSTVGSSGRHLKSSERNGAFFPQGHHQYRSAVDNRSYGPTFVEPTSYKSSYRSSSSHDHRSKLPQHSAKAKNEGRRKHDLMGSRAKVWHEKHDVNPRVNVRSLNLDNNEPSGQKRRKGNPNNQRPFGLTRFETASSRNSHTSRSSLRNGFPHRQILDRSHFLPALENLHGKDTEAKMGTHNEFDNGASSASRIPKTAHLKRRRSNIILIMTDDLDVELGSLNYMPRLLHLMAGEGALLPNAYTTTPMCCPSRSSMLTGMYIHNHQVFTNHQNCSSPLWQNTHERRSFASYLSNAGYKTGYFGKYLNRYNGSHVPDGWQEWGALLMNSRYYNYTVNRNSHHVKYGNRYPHDYYPHVITEDGLRFLKESEESPDPFLLVLSYPAPHGPEDSAPEHAHKFFNASDHHTASYNYAPNPDKQWMLQFTHRMPDIQLKYSDLLMTKRLQTLQTIDSAVEKIVKSVEEIGALDNTYIFFTSDHGYHLGQFGLAKGKSMPFEFDIKVPFFVRGPGIAPGTDLPQIALNIDLAPTFLDIAGVARPPQMDGRSLLPVFKSSSAPYDNQNGPWRDSFLIESSGRLREEEELEKKEQRSWERERAITMTLLKATSGLEENTNHTLGDDDAKSINHVSLYTSKHEKLEEVCQRKEFAIPCKETQKWHCQKIGSRWKIKKCRHRSTNPKAIWQKHCICQFVQGFGTYGKLDVRERRMQKNFLKKYVTKDFRTFDSKFIKSFKNIHIPLQYGFRPSLNHDNPRAHKRKRNGRNRYRRSMQEMGRNNSFLFPFESGLKGSTNASPEEAPSEGAATEAFEDGGVPHNASVDDLPMRGEEEEGEEEVSPTPPNGGEDLQNLGFPESISDDSVHDFVEEEELRDLEDQIHDITDEIQSLESVTSSSVPVASGNVSTSGSPKHGCHTTEGHIDCQEQVYSSMSAWTSSKVAIEDHIRRLRQQLHVMKNIQRHHQAKKPNLFDIYETSDDYSTFGDNVEDSGDVSYNESDLRSVSAKDVETGNGALNGTAETPEDRVAVGTTSIEAVPASASQTPVDPRRSKNPLLSLPEVGLDLPLVEDVNFPMEKPGRGKPRNRNGLLPSRKAMDGDYYFETTEKEEEEEDVGTGGGKLYYPVTLPHDADDDDDKIYGNDSMQSRFCWCDRRIIQKMAVQKARERKRLERQKIKEKRQHRKQKKKSKTNFGSCNYSTLNCYTHDNDHWRTPPLWTDGPFCFCINSANNTYWCLRTINDTHNFLYCEFITGLITYYDLHIDPYQLRNVAFTLSNERVLELNEKLTSLRSCKGADECDGRSQKQERKPKKRPHGSREMSNQSTGMKYSPNSSFQGPYNRMNKADSVKRKKEKKFQDRQEKRRFRKERRKFKKAAKFGEYLDTLSENPFIESEDYQHNVRIARKSRHNKHGKKQKRRERKAQKKKARRRKKMFGKKKPKESFLILLK